MNRRIVSFVAAAGAVGVLFWGLAGPGAQAACPKSSQAEDKSDTVAAPTADKNPTIYGKGDPAKPSGYIGFRGSSPAVSGYAEASSANGGYVVASDGDSGYTFSINNAAAGPTPC